ncbi:uncharacterized protein LOC134446898 isoform X2 [Engraulis encrasicolus]|uniref:uncharacterized protein LOC134446898 isoform X2 n=1 Tax=Engraulis encrasicolus TaxID=184585 RepID=UPI002FD58268
MDPSTAHSLKVRRGLKPALRMKRTNAQEGQGPPAESHNGQGQGDASRRCPTPCPTIQRQEMAAFLRLFDDDLIKHFLWMDPCCKITDKYLLAMTCVYFKRACFSIVEHNRANFFIALYLANTMEEDDEEGKYEILPWALGKNWTKQEEDAFLKQRDRLWARMDYRAAVSRRYCEEVMNMVPSHFIWQRVRAKHHSGAQRVYPDQYKVYIPRGPTASPPKPCSLCAEYAVLNASSSSSSSSPCCLSSNDCSSASSTTPLTFSLPISLESTPPPAASSLTTAGKTRSSSWLSKRPKRQPQASICCSQDPAGGAMAREGEHDHTMDLIGLQEPPAESHNGQGRGDASRLCPTLCPTIQSQEMAAFLRLFDDDLIQHFLWMDPCCKITDKYLLAMTFVYFKRACFSIVEHNRANFFIALYLANTMEEDDEEGKYEILPWALGKNWTKQEEDAFLKQRDRLWARMDYRAAVSRRYCEEVMNMVPSHFIWQRVRAKHHSGAQRVYPDQYKVYIPRGPTASPPKPCSLCAEYAILNASSSSSSSSPCCLSSNDCSSASSTSPLTFSLSISLESTPPPPASSLTTAGSTRSSSRLNRPQASICCSQEPAGGAMAREGEHDHTMDLIDLPELERQLRQLEQEREEVEKVKREEKTMANHKRLMVELKNQTQTLLASTAHVAQNKAQNKAEKEEKKKNSGFWPRFLQSCLCCIMVSEEDN